MFKSNKLLAAVLGLSLVATGSGLGCGTSEEESNRWVTTANTNVPIDWDKVNEAYKTANGPEDLEQKINEIYEGDEIISIAVQDTDPKTQVVTGFFDKNTDGKADEAEKIFTINRTITGEGQAQYQTSGHGHYGGYVSPFFGIASGMMMGMMMSSMFSPSYVPMAYVTSPGRAAAIANHRAGYRASHPERFNKRSQSGRSYGGGKSTGGGTRSRGGSRFGSKKQYARVERLA